MNSFSRSRFHIGKSSGSFLVTSLKRKTHILFNFAECWMKGSSRLDEWLSTSFGNNYADISNRTTWNRNASAPNIDFESVWLIRSDVDWMNVLQAKLSIWQRRADALTKQIVKLARNTHIYSICHNKVLPLWTNNFHSCNTFWQRIVFGSIPNFFILIENCFTSITSANVSMLRFFSSLIDSFFVLSNSNELGYVCVILMY